MKTVYDFFPDIESQRKPEHFPEITDAFFWRTFEKCKPYSLIGIDAFYNLFRGIEYLAKHRIEGDIVECGVFLGGAMLAMGDFAKHFGLRNCRFVLYDTFCGFAKGISEIDVHGKEVKFYPHNDFAKAVEEVIMQSMTPRDQFAFVRGMVETTLRAHKPARIALLRLDTDYYESTKVELEELYPRLSLGGMLTIDDYGLFNGARKATDEYLQDKKILLNRVNYSVFSGIKQ